MSFIIVFTIKSCAYSLHTPHYTYRVRKGGVSGMSPLRSFARDCKQKAKYASLVSVDFLSLLFMLSRCIGVQKEQNKDLSDIWQLLTHDCSSGAQDLDSIRLSTYRTACKLRFVQKKCNSECHCHAVKGSPALAVLGADIFPFYILPSRLPPSAPGRHLECHRGFPREWHQHHGPQRWPLSGPPRNGTVHHFLPAEQAHAHHPPDQRGAVHKPAAQLPAGSLWPVSSISPDRRRLVMYSHVWASDILHFSVKWSRNTDYLQQYCCSTLAWSGREPSGNRWRLKICFLLLRRAEFFTFFQLGSSFSK